MRCSRVGPPLAVVLLLVAGLVLPADAVGKPIASVSTRSAVAYGGEAGSTTATPQFVQASGTSLTLAGNPIRLRGAAIYGTSNPGGTASASQVLSWAVAAHLNTIRLVDVFDERGLDDQAPFDETNWAHTDQLLADISGHGMVAVLDLSAFRNHLVNRDIRLHGWQANCLLNGDRTPVDYDLIDPYRAGLASDWQAFLDFVTARVNTVTGIAYKNDPTIGVISIAGEPQPPASEECGKATSTAELTEFYRRTLEMLRLDDTNHLLSSGGLIHTDWQQLYGHDSGIDGKAIFELADNTLPALHTYPPAYATDGTPIDYQTPVLGPYATSLGKPWFTEEFGWKQDVGDAIRAFRYRWLYAEQDTYGSVGALFWNLGPEVAGGSHDANPGTPTTWNVIVAQAESGKIAWTTRRDGNYDIWVMNGDGSAAQPLISLPGSQENPVWSPDGGKIAYANGSQAWLADADGTNAHPLFPSSFPTAASYPSAWSADGTKILGFAAHYVDTCGRSEYDVFVVGADGNAPTYITNSCDDELTAAFSPDASRIVFQRQFQYDPPAIFVANADGSGESFLANGVKPAWTSVGDRIAFAGSSGSASLVTMKSDGTDQQLLVQGGVADPQWSPDGSRLTFSGTSSGDFEIYRINADGSGLTRLTNSPGFDWLPTWGPGQLPVPATAPGAPTSVTAAAGDGQASVGWLAPAYDGGSAITGYTVTAAPGGATQAAAAGATSATVSGLTNGTAYTFTLTATNAIGTGPASDPSAPVTPQAGAPPPQTATASIPPGGGTATTDPGTGPTPSDPITTSVAVPATTSGGTVTIAETAVTETPPTGGYQFLGQQVDITSTATGTSPSNPLTIVFTIDSSAIRSTLGLGPSDPLPAADQVDITRAETASPVVIPPCTVTAPAINPDPCVSDRRYINGGDDLGITLLTGSASHWNTVVKPVAVTVTDAGYNPRTVTVAQGGIVVWTFAGSKSHSATDNLKLGPAKAPLFSSGVRASGRYGSVFRAAATYTYGSTVKGDPGSFAGTVAVPVRISPPGGGTTTSFTITWSSTTLTGYVFDVQYRFMKAGSKSWSPLKAWKTGATTASAAFSPTSGAGTYAFSARLRNATTGNAALWSPETTIAVQ